MVGNRKAVKVWLTILGLGSSFALISTLVFVVYGEKFLFDPDQHVAIDENTGNGQCEGTPPRVEREFKLGIYSRTNQADPRLAVETAFAALKSKLGSGVWKAPQIFQQSYRIDRDPMQFVSRDFYFDTLGKHLADRSISYRLRYRFRSMSQLLEHEQNQVEKQFFPYRVEVQAKIGRDEKGGGRSEVDESRFEWREESPPFSRDYPPPEAPWLPQHFVRYAQTGIFENHRMRPTCELLKAVPELANAKEYALFPDNVVVTRRERMHLDISTPYGSGPNPDQAFILSFDHAMVYPAKPYLESLNWFSGIKRPDPIHSFIELEVEFERNVSTLIDQAIGDGEDSVAPEALVAFTSDQATIISILRNALTEKGYALAPKSSSKFVQAARAMEHHKEWHAKRFNAPRIYGPSGVAQLPDGKVIVVDDKLEHHIFVGGFGVDQALDGGKLSLKKAFNKNGQLHEARKLQQLEDVAVDANGHVNIITSFSRNKEGEIQDDHEKLVRFRLESGLISEASIITNLRNAMASVAPVIKNAADHKDAESKSGMNIEGLAYDPTQKHLLIGFRSPVVDGHAVVLRVQNPDLAFHGKQPPSFGEPQYLDLAGAGIRGMTYDERLNGFAIISGPANGKNAAFRLWLWDGLSKSPQMLRTKIEIDLDRAEGITPIRLGDEAHLMIVYDDGDKESGQGGTYRLIDYDGLKVRAANK